ncbi:glycosyltransferase family 9 protein [Cochleicola gelatinilyticus]|uniref:Heptosyltransferase n=1 Tax=Cochleicola gelatinilyticus TaxID=1763537 RepID=A0A167JFZ6_9FLAO|nr:glycosyltransferase family 9 protein [Cochleicola gelatinilyticus]OAB80635.1 heptosyltransferase [Cochleicola gelatinilyticus]
MGDVAMTVPVLRVLLDSYPELQLTILSKPGFKPLFSDLHTINFLEADVYGKHKGFGLLGLANEAKALGVDAVADLHNVIRSKILKNALCLRGIPTATIDKGRAEKKALTQNHGGSISPLESTHERYANVFKKLGYPIDLKKHTFPERQRLSPQLNALIGVEPKKLIGIAPFAAYKSKQYSLSLLTEVIEMLNASGKYRIFLFGGGKKEIEILKKLEAKYASATNLAGRFSLEAELAFISNLDVMLAMDSANGHLAAMYGIPVVTLWGVTHPYAGFVPFQQPNSNQLVSNRDEFPLLPTSIYGNKFPKGYEKAMDSIPPELVVQKIKENL